MSFWENVDLFLILARRSMVIVAVNSTAVVMQSFFPSQSKTYLTKQGSHDPATLLSLSLSFFNPFTATGYFDIPPPRWPTFLAMLFPILKEGMGLSLLDEFEVQYHVIKK